jgi:hypothetical protein
MAGSSLVDEFCRAGELQHHFFRRCQREFRDAVMPSLDFLEAEGDVAGVRAKLAELDALRAENADLKKQLKRQKPEPVGVR